MVQPNDRIDRSIFVKRLNGTDLIIDFGQAVYLSDVLDDADKNVQKNEKRTDDSESVDEKKE